MWSGKFTEGRCGLENYRGKMWSLKLQREEVFRKTMGGTCDKENFTSWEDMVRKLQGNM